jgi:hypothetical protein
VAAAKASYRGLGRYGDGGPRVLGQLRSLRPSPGVLTRFGSLRRVLGNLAPKLGAVRLRVSGAVSETGNEPGDEPDWEAILDVRGLVVTQIETTRTFPGLNDVDAMVAAYQGGATGAAVAEQFGVHRSTGLGMLTLAKPHLSMSASSADNSR